MADPDHLIERFVIRDFDPPSVAFGVRWLVEYAHTRRMRYATIYTAARGSIENLSEAIGPQHAARLQHKHSTVMNGITVESAMRRGYPRHQAPVLAVWVSDQELIDRLDRTNVPALCAIPWSDELTNWIGKWEPIDLMTGEAVESRQATFSNPTVASAVESVTQMANLSNGLDSRNRGLMGHALLILLGAGEPVDPDELEAWAAQNGWGARNATEIRQMLEQLRRGARLRLGSNPFGTHVLDHWRGESS